MLKLINLRTVSKIDICKQLSPYILSRTTTTSGPADTKTQVNDFKLIYKLPYIRHATLLNKSKIVQAGLTALSIPTCGVLSSLGMVSPEQIYVVGAIGITGCITLTLVGTVATDLIGLVYLNSSKTVARVAYLNFWGQRKNVDIPVEDIIPGSEIPSTYMSRFFTYLKRYSTTHSLKIMKTHGIFADKEDFDDVFGIV